MKKIYAIFLMFIFLSNFYQSFSWDSEIAKYFPLQVGNRWVYKSIFIDGSATGRLYNIYTVTGIIDTLSERYYYLQRSIVVINPPTGYGVLFPTVRIDSTTMNIYSFIHECDLPENLVDSLLARKNDSSFICIRPTFRHISFCFDTAAYTIFNNSIPSKKYNHNYDGWTVINMYAKGIGLVFHYSNIINKLSYDTLKGCIINGVIYGDTSTIVGINHVSTEVPDKFSLSQNYPNPFNPTTNIKFQLPKSGLVKLVVFDLLGKEIQTLVNEQLSPGTYEVDFDGSSLPSGVYYYKLESGVFTETKKMVLIK